MNMLLPHVGVQHSTRCLACSHFLISSACRAVMLYVLMLMVLACAS
jgi:hypothetical protein